MSQPTLKELSVAAIENGTVIDHIKAGFGMRIVRLLKLAGHDNKVTLGLNLPSKSMGLKDIIKVEEREISEVEASQIAVFAPKATLNIIRNYEKVKKFTVSMPSEIVRVFQCPNERCVTNHEALSTRFWVGKKRLICCYCEKSFAHEVL